MVNGPRDPYIGQANAGSKNKSLTMTTSYVEVMRENAARTGFSFENTGSTNIYIKYNGEEWIITPYGSFSRNKLTGSVWTGAIEAKGASGSETLVAEES